MVDQSRVQRTIRVTEYCEFRQLARAFANGHYELLTILGHGGIGKSEIVNRMMRAVLGGNRYLLLKGKHTPLDLYQRLYHARTLPIVLDDLDGILRSPDNTAILKCLCDTTPVKRVEWGSMHTAFTRPDNPLPNSFESISRVCLLANDVVALNANISAVQDRGVLIHFVPSALEVHREVARGGWFDDAEVFDFIGRNLFLLSHPSFRFYLTGKSHKMARLDWRDLILRTMEIGSDPKLILVARLLADRSLETQPEAAREQAFKALGGGSRATYHRFKRQLLERRGAFDLVEAASITLGNPVPDPFYQALHQRRQQLEEMRDGEADLDVQGNADAQPKATTVPVDNAADVDRLACLRCEMDMAVQAEDYESAAIIRDKIKQLEREIHEADNGT